MWFVIVPSSCLILRWKSKLPIAPSLSESEIVDDLVWKDCVDYSFPRDSPSRPLINYLMWEKKIEEDLLLVVDEAIIDELKNSHEHDRVSDDEASFEIGHGDDGEDVLDKAREKRFKTRQAIRSPSILRR